MVICFSCMGTGSLVAGDAPIDASGNKVSIQGSHAANVATGICYQCNGKGYCNGGGSL